MTMRRSLDDYREYDNYPIPKYDPNLSDEERKRIKVECEKNLRKLHEETLLEESKG